jgi:hypothetical protein
MLLENTVADILAQTYGIDAYAENTGGGNICVVIEINDVSVYFGTADQTWSGQPEIVEAFTVPQLHALVTDTSSESIDPEEIADGIAIAAKRASNR